MGQFGDVPGRVMELVAAVSKLEPCKLGCAIDPAVECQLCRITASAMFIIDEFGSLDYFFCPITGRVIEGASNDDKVLCGCGRTNPLVTARTLAHVEEASGTSHHIKRFLAIATRGDFVYQRADDEKASR